MEIHNITDRFHVSRKMVVQKFYVNFDLPTADFYGAAGFPLYSVSLTTLMLLIIMYTRHTRQVIHV